jgi:alanyl-tRNA synthetase
MDNKVLRQKFLDFFKNNGHQIISSSSLIPSEVDSSVLFTTAGMQQFKRFYLEPKEAPNARVATCQKCLRTGDIDEVGDESHLTFFEMLGNFSFGYPEMPNSYFKEEAIKLAWKFLTEILNIEKNRITCTYFAGDKGIVEDHESHELLKRITGLDESKILGTGFSETFWSLGTEGSPGGPTVEFYIDGIEVWNLVFNEYRLENGGYVGSQLKGVDTGMGLERLLAVINNAENVYHTDLFEKPHQKLHEFLQKEDPISERIILDHLKAATFLITEGIEPSNKDQGYVVRRLIRRAIVKAKQIGIEKDLTMSISEAVVETYESVYPDLRDKLENVKQTLQTEEEKFRKTLTLGLKEFAKMIGDKNGLIGDESFNLYQTYGFPLELTQELIKDKGLTLDKAGFEAEFKKHQELSRTASAGMFKGGLADAGEETKKLHTAAHLLLAALRQVFGDDVFQKGSNITSDRLRFDFSYSQKLTAEQLKQVENLVNEQIKKAIPVEMVELSLEEAKSSGAMGVFENKYGDKVKVYTIGSPSASSGLREKFFSREICGGPHANNTSELGHFKIAKEESSSAGVRRIKAILEYPRHHF